MGSGSTTSVPHVSEKIQPFRICDPYLIFQTYDNFKVFVYASAELLICGIGGGAAWVIERCCLFWCDGTRVDRYPKRGGL